MKLKIIHIVSLQASDDKAAQQAAKLNSNSSAKNLYKPLFYKSGSYS